jgi:hypothetical protein
MPFGVPCDLPPVEELIRSITAINTTIGNIVYNVVFPIGQRLTIQEKVLGTVTKILKGKVKTALNHSGSTMGDVLQSIGDTVNEQISNNITALASAQNAIATTPLSYSPDIPAADIRRVPVPKPQAEAIALVSNVIRQADQEVSQLLHLLYLLGVTPAQVRRYLSLGTIPDVWLCPNPNAHDVATLEPLADVPANGLWADAGAEGGNLNGAALS